MSSGWIKGQGSGEHWIDGCDDVWYSSTAALAILQILRLTCCGQRHATFVVRLCGIVDSTVQRVLHASALKGSGSQRSC